MSRTFTIVAISLVALSACREDPGEPNYPDFEVPDSTNPNFFPGPFPYQKGDERLSVGVFYEGGASEIIEIDNISNNYFIYESTYDQFPSDDRLEGEASDQLVISSAQLWWGGGVVWSSGRDLTGWTTMHVSLKGADASFEGMEIQMESGTGAAPVSVTNYGFVADDEWHSLVIPLTDFVGVDIADVTIPVSFLNGSGPTGAVLLIDDLYFTKE